AKLTSGLNSGRIFVGNSSNVAEAFVLSGDATISNTGILLINNGAVNNAKISDVAFSKISGKPTTLAGYTITMISSDITTALGYTPGSGGGTVGSVTSAATSGNPITVSTSSTSPSIDITRATASVNGYLASSDFSTFINKLNANQAAVETALGYVPVASGLTSGFIYVGNGSNLADGVQLSGDASLSNTGILSLSNTGVGAGTFSKLTVDLKGRVTASGVLNSNDITTALGYTPGSGGGTVGSVTSAATSGNPITVSTSSTSPSIDISRATASVNGYLASSDFTTFTNKLASGLLSTKIFVGNSSNVAEAMVLSGDATISNTGLLLINNGAINNAKISDVAFSKISGKPTTLAGYGITMISSDVTTALGYTPGSGGGTVASVTSAATSGNPITVSTSSTSPSIDITRATASVNGYLASSDFTAFSNKLTSGLLSTKIFVGNSSNVAEAMILSGDATISNTGILSLSNTGIGAGTYTKVTVDVKGRVTASAALISSDITTALGYTPGSGGGTVSSVTSAATSGNPITVSASSTSPSIDISRATVSVNGYLASSDFTAFSNKLTSTLNSALIFVGNGSNVATGVSLSGDATINNFGVLTLANTVSASTSSKVTFDSKGRITASAALISSDITTALGYTPGSGGGTVSSVTSAATSGNPITVSASSTSPSIDISRATALVNGYLASSDFSTFNNKLGTNLLSTRIFVGNSSNFAEAFVLSGDATISNTGILSLSNTGIGAGTYTKVTVDVKGRVTGSVALISSDITTALGYTPGSGGGTVSSVTSAATSGNPITVSASSTSPSIDISRATAFVNGYLASSDFSIFAAKGSGSVTGATAAVTAGNPITVSTSITSPSIDITRATASVNGYLASSDFSIFLAKGSGSVTGATAAATSGNPITVSASSTSPSIDITRATASANGYLASSDFSIFLAKGSGSVTGATAAVTAGNPITVSASSASPSIDITRATALVNGYLASSDFTAFSNKLTSTLNSALIFVGNGSNVATGVSLSGDATINNLGVLTLANTVSASTSSKVTFDSKGRITASAALISSDITTALGYTPGASGGTVSSVTSAATSGNPITVSASSTSPSIDISKATATVNGYLASSDFTTFNGKQAGSAELTGLAALASNGFVRRTAAGTYTSIASMDLTTSVTGTLPVANGGIGATTAGNNLIFAGPTTGGPLAPSFRSLASSDIPNLSSIYLPLTGGALTGTLDVQSTNTATSGNIFGAKITPTYNQASGTAANTDLLINRTQTLVGSGQQNLIDAQVAGVSKFRVDNTGKVYGDGSGLTGVGGGLSGLTAGRVPLSASATTIADSANFTFNSTTGAMAINGTAPAIAITGSATLSSTATLTLSGTTAVSLSGNTSVSGANTFATGTGAVSLNGTATIAAGKNLVMASGAGIKTQTFTGTTTTADSVVGNSLTTGTLISATTSNASVNSTNGLLYVANTGASTTGTVARIQASLTAGSGLTVLATGNVGIGTTAPNAKLSIQGAATSRTNIITSGAVVDLSLSNNHLLKAPGTSSITLQNPVDGGVYTLIIADVTPTIYTFSGCTNSYYSPTNTTTVDRTTFTILSVVDGVDTNCFITWITGFN
ncbi:MAG: hypothetical protein H7328_08630, partial [Bdellovibrio sp.]|nr:hypothetical protein [Bdellovibrio sp.]